MSDVDNVDQEEPVVDVPQAKDAETQATADAPVPWNIDWRNWLIRTNFTDYATLLQAIPVGKLDDEANMRAMAAAFENCGPPEARGVWSFDILREEFSLFGCEVLYNGKNSRDFPTLSLWKNCVKVKWPAWSVNPPAGQELYLCFNNPPVAAKE